MLILRYIGQLVGLLPESSGFLAGLVVAQYKETQVLQLVVGSTQLAVPQEVMPPRRRGRSRGLFQESGGQNEDQYSVPSHTLESSGEEEAAAPPAPVERMDVVIARFQRMSSPIFNGDDSSEDADSWLHRGGACLTAGAVSIPLEISLTLPLPPALSPAEIVLSVKIWHHTFTAHMANQIKRHNASSLTYENFPGGHPSQYCSHPCTLNSTIPPPRSIENASWETRTPDLALIPIFRIKRLPLGQKL
ncbi:phosphopantothenate--cysteine ligase 1 [Dorcoceras hygrometricum]|uniref:Phosphopantothenate--cysteine ligase 1 n=1 Tax=Dorcoceras hygrometricum TaxID=472368 RepID=A0A2Z7AWJ1_9LAMI|nr:phosphopantothenate--cysteine ligase 1 [Dorcoceras hygrometricum]